jgi:hypothetical protein
MSKSSFKKKAEYCHYIIGTTGFKTIDDLLYYLEHEKKFKIGRKTLVKRMKVGPHTFEALTAPLKHKGHYNPETRIKARAEMAQLCADLDARKRALRDSRVLKYNP